MINRLRSRKLIHLNSISNCKLALTNTVSQKSRGLMNAEVVITETYFH